MAAVTMANSDVYRGAVLVASAVVDQCAH